MASERYERLGAPAQFYDLPAPVQAKVARVAEAYRMTIEDWMVGAAQAYAKRLRRANRLPDDLQAVIGSPGVDGTDDEESRKEARQRLLDAFAALLHLIS